MKKLFRLSIMLLMSVFLMGGIAMSDDKTGVKKPLFPDTSYCEGSLLNVADLSDKIKYFAFKAVAVSDSRGLIVTYHIGLKGIQPTYVSLLWHRGLCVGFVYYANGAFDIWMKSSPYDPLFRQYNKTPRNQIAFQLDFQKLYKKEFPLLEIS